MLTRRYVERRIEKCGFWNPTNGRIYVEGVGLLHTTPTELAEAIALCFAYETQVVYIMPARGRWNDKRGQYPGKLDWQKSGLELAAYYCNHSATIRLAGGEYELDMVPIGLWFPSFTEDMNMSDVVRAMHYLKDLLTKYFQPIEVAKGKREEYRVELMSTPARTGMDLLRRKLPYGIKYPDLPPEVEHIVMTEFGQARTELFDHGQTEIEHLYNYDGLWMYASCCRHMPVGGVVHDFDNIFAGPYVTGLYRVEARIPDAWAHIGLLPVRFGDRSTYPRQPGMLLESWCGHRDLRLALDYGWEILQIKERVLWPDTQARGKKIGQDPLRHWMETLVLLRQEISKQYDEPIRSFLRGAFRNLLNHTIGSLHRSIRKIDAYAESFLDYAEIVFEGGDYSKPKVLDDGSVAYQTKEQLNAFQKENFKPHWALEVWNQCKWKVTKAALEVPYDQLLAIRTDGLWTTCSMPDFVDTGKPGCFRKKDLIETGPFEWPHKKEEIDMVIRRARGD